MEVVEDLSLGVVLKRAGFRQRAVYGSGLIRLRWAEGMTGVLNNMTKNLFAIFRFRLALASIASIGIGLLSLVPVLGLCVGYAGAAPFLVYLGSLALLYSRYHRLGLPPAGYCVSFPLGALLFLFAIARSTLVTLGKQGVTWRGTFYPLNALRKNAQPFL
jgi:hypothetical protein